MYMTEIGKRLAKRPRLPKQVQQLSAEYEELIARRERAKVRLAQAREIAADLVYGGDQDVEVAKINSEIVALRSELQAGERKERGLYESLVELVEENRAEMLDDAWAAVAAAGAKHEKAIVELEKSHIALSEFVDVVCWLNRFPEPGRSRSLFSLALRRTSDDRHTPFEGVVAALREQAETVSRDVWETSRTSGGGLGSFGPFNQQHMLAQRARAAAR